MRHVRILLALVVLAVVAETCNDGGGNIPPPAPPSPTGPGLGVQFVAVSVGNNFACALDTNGNAYCWGANTYGQLGNGTGGTAADSNLPKMVSGGLHFTQISAGYDHTCGIARGEVFCWGLRDYDELGDLALGGNQLTPELVGVVLNNDPWVEVTAGGHDSCAVTISGVAQCWGASWLGELGVGTPSPIPVYGATPDVTNSWPPLTLFSLPSLGVAPTALSAGRQHTCGVSKNPTGPVGSDGPVFCWGDNLDSEVSPNAADTCPSSGSPATIPCSIKPVSLGGYQALAVTAGGDFSCGLSSGRIVACWGSDEVGQLGSTPSNKCTFVFTTIFCNPTPTALNTSFTFSQVSAGFEFACAVIFPQATLPVWCWGADDHGQLGTTDPQLVHPCASIGGTTPLCATVPVPVDLPLPAQALQVSAGFDSACAVTTSHTIFCWGNNSRGQLGDGMTGGTSARAVKVVA